MENELAETFNTLSIENSHLMEGLAKELELEQQSEQDELNSMEVDEVDEVEHLKQQSSPKRDQEPQQGSQEPQQGSHRAPDDNNLAVDEAFQNSLNERANQFLYDHQHGPGNQLKVPKPQIDWKFSDSFDILHELDGWFTSLELEKLVEFKKCYFKYNSEIFIALSEEKQNDLMTNLLVNLSTSSNLKETLQMMCFLCLGCFEEFYSVEEHFNLILSNNLKLINLSSLQLVCSCFKELSSAAATSTTNLREINELFFYINTILYFQLNSLIYIENNSNITKYILELRTSKIYQFIIKSVEEFRFNGKASMRIRNSIIILSKLNLLLFGDLAKRNKCKTFLNLKYGIIKQTNPNLLMCSPIDYFVFRQELISRFPCFIPPPSKLPSNFDNASSLSQFINVPRSVNNSKLNESLPAPQIDLATPSNNPLSNRSNKSKRNFQTNQKYPLLFPTSEDNPEVPTSIKEATDIISSRIQDKLSLKQLWFERDLFMKQERGFSNVFQLDIKDDFDYSEDLEYDYINEIYSLLIIEETYNDCIENFNSLIHVLLQIVVSYNTLSQDLFNSDGGATPELLQKVELLTVKEHLIKYSSHIILSLLKWFKINHVLKFEHLCTLLYDSNFFGIVIHYFQAVQQVFIDKITNKQLKNDKMSFFQRSSGNQLEHNRVDTDFCFTMTSLLTITSMVCNGKTQRILSLSEKDPATCIFKTLLQVYNLDLWKPMLKIVKDIALFNGKKWKSNNMELVSLVYIHLSLKLRDNWLSGRDLEGELSDAYGQEVALRALLQFYHMRKYSEKMSSLGYARINNDFFTKEMELSA